MVLFKIHTLKIQFLERAVLEEQEQQALMAGLAWRALLEVVVV